VEEYSIKRKIPSSTKALLKETGYSQKTINKILQYYKPTKPEKA
jgi:hypothetical protein